MNKSEFEVLYQVKKCKGIKELCVSNEMLGWGSSIDVILRKLEQLNYISNDGITDDGLRALLPYKVDAAIIMAAGMSSRFVPISLEKPKGLLEVNGDILIERQIKQLKAAGIEKIVLVLGYKKESFFYLKDKYDVDVLINPYYNIKNNIETLYIARKYFGNVYICSSDDYFAENVFEQYVYNSYYASVHVKEKSNEWYMVSNANREIIKVNKFGAEGDIMLGHVYWNKEFSDAFLKLIELHREIGDYDDSLWEQLFADNVDRLPRMNVKTYPNNTIFEFDSLYELRNFDETYIKNSRSHIIRNIATYFGVCESEIGGFAPIKEGLTNTSFVFELNGKRFVYRHPGDGTDEIINRRHEKEALELAKSINIDPTFLYMNDEEGWKISEFVDNIRTPDYKNFEDSKRVIGVLRELHRHKLSVEWEFLPWEESLKIEKLVRAAGPIAMNDFEGIKSNVEKCYRLIQGDGIEKRFCHCDTYAPNWMISGNKTILIDWEYAGNADPGCDLGAYIMDAMYEIDEAERFIKEYCGDEYNEISRVHYLSQVAINSWYWFVWALYRESCGAVMGESLHNWYVMAKKYSEYIAKKY